MSNILSEVKKICKENKLEFHAEGLFGVSDNDSGRCDFEVSNGSETMAVKVFTPDEGAKAVYFYTSHGYITVKCDDGDSDYMWVAPKLPEGTVSVLLVDGSLPMIAIAKNSSVTVTPGAKVFGCRVYGADAFKKLISK